MPLKTIKKLPSHAKHIFERVMSATKGKGYTDEQRGKIAWAAVKKGYKKKGVGKWSKKK